jgi:hypothetical protein
MESCTLTPTQSTYPVVIAMIDQHIFPESSQYKLSRENKLDGYQKGLPEMSIVCSELRDLLPTWAVVVLLPVPVATSWHDGAGRDFAYAYLFLGCAILAAERFGPLLMHSDENPSSRGEPRLWRAKVMALGLAMLAALCVFTACAWAMLGRPDALVPLLATVAIIPALCCVPYLAVVTGIPYAAVLFAVFLLAAVKLVGCLVAIFVYGWNAQEEGHLTLPWERPNLLVWLCLAGAIIMSVVMYPLGRQAFLAQRDGR